MVITVELFKKILLDNIKGYAIEKVLDFCVSAVSTKGKTIEEQFVYCIDENISTKRFPF